ncbi:MAG: hypothetical protein HY904_11855 [Deltaproteobacteria bacterium]|nr:hypothetical protein [Deltaproteobacteria bacterium]
MHAALLIACFIVAEPPQVGARVVSGPEADSNARREISGQVPQPDLLWRSQARVELSRRERNQRVGVEGQWGHKVFATQRSEDVQALEARARWDARPLDGLGLFAETGGRDRRQRSGARSYTTWTGDLGASLGPWGPLPVSVSFGAGPRAFAFWPYPQGQACKGDRFCPAPLAELTRSDLRLPDDSLARFSNAGAGGFAALLVQLSGAEVLSLTAAADGRYFPLGWSATKIVDGARVFDERGPPSGARGILDQLRRPTRRADGTLHGELTLESVRVLYLRAAARVTGNTSLSRGESYLRGRLALTAGGLLPGGARVLVEGQLQATRWPEGLGLGERLALQEGDESQTSLAGQLSVPLRGGVWVEARTAAYTAEFAAGRTPFLRLVAFAGLGWRW